MGANNSVITSCYSSNVLLRQKPTKPSFPNSTSALKKTIQKLTDGTLFSKVKTSIMSIQIPKLSKRDDTCSRSATYTCDDITEDIIPNSPILPYARTSLKLTDTVEDDNVVLPGIVEEEEETENVALTITAPGNEKMVVEQLETEFENHDDEDRSNQILPLHGSRYCHRDGIESVALTKSLQTLVGWEVDLSFTHIFTACFASIHHACVTRVLCRNLHVRLIPCTPHA